MVGMENTQHISFAAVKDQDLALLYAWFQKPHIADLWKEPHDWGLFHNKFSHQLTRTDCFSFLVLDGDTPFGYIQYHQVNDEDRLLFPDITIPSSSIGIDLFIGEPDYLNKGLGTKFIKEFLTFVQKKEPLCHMILIDPACDNYRAIACYKKVGFRERGAYQVPYGPTGDGPGLILLMTLSL